jgi:hypothetical protein
MVTIATAREYFDQVVAYDLDHYKAQPSSLPAAYNLAGSLFSMHEWVWDSYGDKLELQLGVKLRNAFALNSHTQSNCPEFKYIRDVANASKHVSLINASTQATHITDTTAIESTFGGGVFGGSKFGRGVVVIDDDGTKIDFENTADKVYSYWEHMLGYMR